MTTRGLDLSHTYKDLVACADNTAANIIWRAYIYRVGTRLESSKYYWNSLMMYSLAVSVIFDKIVPLLIGLFFSYIKI